MKNEEINNGQLVRLFEGAFEEAWRSSRPEETVRQMVAGADRLEQAFVAIGNRSYERLASGDGNRGGEQRENADYLITFEWAEQAKYFMILWRDVLFQLQKAQVLLADGRVGEEAVAGLREESRLVLADAAGRLAEELDKAERPPKGRRYGAARKLRQWRLQANPWPVYRKQMKAIPDQCRDLVEQNGRLLEASSALRDISRRIMGMMDACEREIDDIGKLTDKTIALLEGGAGEEGHDRNLGKMASRLEDIEAEQVLPQHLNVLIGGVEQALETLPEKIQAAVGVQAGIIELREISLKKKSRQWLESEIVPLLYEAWELTEGIYNGMKMALVNIRNRALLLSAGSREGKPADFDSFDLSQPLYAQLAAARQAEASLLELKSLVGRRLGESFKLSYLYDTTQPFLPVLLQSTINQLQFSQNRIVARLQRWVTAQQGAIRRFRRTVEQEETLSVSEKIVRYINGWQGDAANSHYSSIFLTRGYIGESFAVGRDDELAHVDSLFRNWENGFRGAVAVTGQRHSGKSLFGELLANRFFPDKALRLQPDAAIQVQGRRMKGTYDLRAALAFIRKYTLNVRPLIWIDDLELWWEPGLPLCANIRALMKFIDSYSDDIFFVVSMSNTLREFLRGYLSIDKVFQAEISMDYMSAAEVKDAVLIRHGATHSRLVDAEGQELSPKQFRKKTRMIHRASRGNIGDALMRWSGTTRKLDGERVVNEFSTQYPLPDFLNPDSALLLSSVMLQKRTNEYRLRKLFGPAFPEKYGSALQRLINVGVLRRQQDGWLEINELLVNDLGYLLERKNHIRYR